jgi:hypothetical protein
MADLKDDLVGKTWLHSHEEDTPTEMVFRPSTYRFPPSRGGRIGFQLHHDGTALALGPGPTDKPEQQPADWTIGPNKLELRIPDKEEVRSYTIASADADRIAVRKS